MDFKKQLFWGTLWAALSWMIDNQVFLFAAKNTKVKSFIMVKEKMNHLPKFLPKPTVKCTFPRTLSKNTVNHHQSPHGEKDHQKANKKQYFFF